MCHQAPGAFGKFRGRVIIGRRYRHGYYVTPWCVLVQLVYNVYLLSDVKFKGKTSMRTIVSKGPQTELEIVEATALTADAGEVIVDVRAIGVGRVDLIMLQLMPTDFVPGVEVAGIVTSTGPDVDPQWVGRRVFARVHAGAYAEQVVVRSTAIVALPDEVSFEAGVASGVNALVAHLSLTKAQFVAGETVVVRGAR